MVDTTAAADPRAQQAVLLACFSGKKTAAKRRRGLEAELRSQGDHVLDTTVVEVDINHQARVYDPHRVVAGALTSALTWGLFGLVTGGVASLLISAVLGAAWGGWMARAHAHHATGAQLARAGAYLQADSSALLTFAETKNAQSILAAARAHDATVVSVTAIADDLRARIFTGLEDDAAGAASNPDLSMVILRFHNRGAADQAVRRIAETPAAAGLNVELVIDTDDSGRRHVVDPTLGAGAVARYNLRSWAVLGLICGALAGVTGGGGLLGFLSGGILTAVAWGLFGLAAGALYGLWAGRAISARRLKGFAPMLAPDTSLIFAWADAPPSEATLASLSTAHEESLVVGSRPPTVAQSSASPDETVKLPHAVLVRRRGNRVTADDDTRRRQELPCNRQREGGAITAPPCDGARSALDRRISRSCWPPERRSPR